VTEETSKLLTTGVHVYPDGLRAMARFRHEIYLGTRRSMTRNLEKLAAATRMELKAAGIKPYASPDGFAEEIDWDHLIAIVGAKLTIPGRTTIYATMWWNHDPSRDETPLAVSVAFEPWFAVWRRSIMLVAQQIEGEKAYDEDSQIWLQEDVSSDNIRDFEDLFDGIFSR
jgi:hypothetical protein